MELGSGGNASKRLAHAATTCDRWFRVRAQLVALLIFQNTYEYAEICKTMDAIHFTLFPKTSTVCAAISPRPLGEIKWDLNSLAGLSSALAPVSEE